MKRTIPIILLVVISCSQRNTSDGTLIKESQNSEVDINLLETVPKSSVIPGKTVFENFSDLRGYGHFKEFLGAVIDDHHTYSIHVNELNHSEFLVVFSKTLRISNTLGGEDTPERLHVLLDTLLVVNSEPNWVFNDPPCFLDNKYDREIFALVNGGSEAIRHEFTYKAWRLSRSKRKIIEIDPSQITCDNMSYGI